MVPLECLLALEHGARSWCDHAARDDATHLAFGVNANDRDDLL
jgi:hypothetical protein